MKTILCYGDSNTWGCPPMMDQTSKLTRYGTDVRWGSVLRSNLGADYWVIEEGLGGRTTIHDDPFGGANLNGRRFLSVCLGSHHPIDLVVLMLGTNDLKSFFNLSAAEIARGAGTLLGIIQNSGTGPNDGVPKILLICPPPLARLTYFSTMFVGAAEKSHQLATYYQEQAAIYGCEFLDAGQIVTSSDRDGIHLEPADQQRLGQAVSERVRPILA